MMTCVVGLLRLGLCAFGRQLLDVPLLQGRPRRAALRAGDGRLPAVLTPGPAHRQSQLRPLHGV